MRRKTIERVAIDTIIPEIISIQMRSNQMQAAEAITILMGIVEARSSSMEIGLNYTQEQFEKEQLALAIADAMLNSMIPVARFRAFVEIAENFKPTKKHPVANVTQGFTVCAVTIEAIKSAIAGVAINDMDIRVVIYEQTSAGAGMVSGFQGFTKSQKFRSWYKTLDQLQQANDETVQ